MGNGEEQRVGDPTPSFAGTEAGNLTSRGAAESDPPGARGVSATSGGEEAGGRPRAGSPGLQSKGGQGRGRSIG